MASDPATLLAQANCYACYGIGGTFQLLELVLVAQWANETINLIPSGTLYPAGLTYTYPAVIGGVYQVTLLGNDNNVTSGSFSYSLRGIPQTFTATTTSIVFTGVNAGFPVTAILYRFS